MSTTQRRIMRTYEVTLTAPDQPDRSARLNLSYELNDELDAVDWDGTIVMPTSIQAKIEVMKRLRKLAARHATTVTPADIDETDWDIRLSRSTFIDVPLDDNGRPIPKGH